eukprot:233030-Pleurochrysis_carterae.AAC.1
MLTSEFTAQLKRPSKPGVTYCVEAQITEVRPPIVIVQGALSQRAQNGENVHARQACSLPSMHLAPFLGFRIALMRAV